MKGFVGTYHVSSFFLLGAAAADLALAVSATPMQGFVGTYHVSNKTVGGSTTETGYDAFAWGTVVIDNGRDDGGWMLADSLEYHCGTGTKGRSKDINSVYAVMVPHSEGGVVNNPNDTALYDPAKPHPGLVQGAERFSKLAATCPQMTGVIIDDFLQNYRGNETGCAKCPASHPFAYGNANSGEYCCPWPIDSTGHCKQPENATAKNLTECCILPGADLACQGNARCGVNPDNHRACGAERQLTITLDDVIQIKCALVGKTVDMHTGRCDLNSRAKTPQLRLFLTWYTRFTEHYVEDGLLSGRMPTSLTIDDDDDANGIDKGMPIVDGISLWIEGTNQNKEYTNWTAEYFQFRQITDAARRSVAQMPRLAVYGGSYIEHSRIGILPPGPFKDMLNKSIELYDMQELSGFFFFAGGSLPKLNASMWDSYDLVNYMGADYQPWIGSACGAVGTTAGQRVQVVYGNEDDHPDQHLRVKNTLTGENGTICFGGWIGRAKRTPHLVFSTDESGISVFVGRVQLVGGQTVSFQF